MLPQPLIFLSPTITVLVNFETRVLCFLLEEKPFSAELAFFFVRPPALQRLDGQRLEASINAKKTVPPAWTSAGPYAGSRDSILVKPMVFCNYLGQPRLWKDAKIVLWS